VADINFYAFDKYIREDRLSCLTKQLETICRTSLKYLRKIFLLTKSKTYMWIRKTNEELKTENIKKEKSARKTGILTALLFFPLEIFYSKFIGTKSRMGGNTLLGPTLTWNEILKDLPTTLIICGLLGLSMYFFTRKFRQVSSLICDSCGKIKRFDKIKDCDCGGHFDFFDNMKWVENNETKNDNRTEK